MAGPFLPPMATGATFCSGIGAPEIAAPLIAGGKPEARAIKGAT